jgi:hypothetical protein
MVMHICNPRTGEAEAGGSWVPGQPGLHSETLCQKIKFKGDVQMCISSMHILCHLI